jgi:Mg2+-importing ATPase
MTDFPEMTIATDSVDTEMVEQPRRWDIKAIRKFMITFGLVSSVFDYLTFGVLLFILHAAPEQFRAGWFMESVISASLVVLVVRTRRPFFKSMPGRLLLAATLLIVVFALGLPFTIIGGRLFGFSPLPLSFLALMGAIVVLYILSAELVKKAFYQKVEF